MKSTHLFQLSLEEAGCFLTDCFVQALKRVLQQSPELALASQPQSQEAKLLNTAAVCQLLGITRVTCDAWRKAGKLPYKRIAGRIYFSEQEVLAALHSFNRRAR